MSKVISIHIDKDSPESRRRAQSRIGALPPGDYELRIEKLSSRRSSQNNRRYWGYVVEPIRCWFSEQGQEYTREQLHAMLTQEFLPVEIHDPVTGEIRIVGGETKNLDTQAFDDYTMRVEVWAGERGIELEPSPLEAM